MSDQWTMITQMQKQLNKIRNKRDLWVCLIVSNNNGHLIQGFIKSKDYPNMRTFSVTQAASLPLKTTKEFVAYMNVKRPKKKSFREWLDGS